MSDPASAEAMYRPPAFELLTTASDVFHLEQPAPVLWRDPDPRTDPGEVDAVLSVDNSLESRLPVDNSCGDNRLGTP